MVFNIEVVFNS